MSAYGNLLCPQVTTICMVEMWPQPPNVAILHIIISGTRVIMPVLTYYFNFCQYVFVGMSYSFYISHKLKDLSKNDFISDECHVVKTSNTYSLRTNAPSDSKRPNIVCKSFCVEPKSVHVAPICTNCQIQSMIACYCNGNSQLLL